MKMLDGGAGKDEIFDQTGQVVGVFDASFSVKRGEIFVIMGLSGSGKSTMVRLFNRLIEPTSGSIFLNGKEITGLKDKDLLGVRRRDMSMVFQSFALMPHMTVLDNTAFGLEVSNVGEQERYRRSREALAQVGLAGHEYSFPNQLSGGMQQRVGLARALANDPAILLMDEAFSALDPLIRSEMQGELIKLQAEAQRTIVFISHDLDEALRIGHRIAIMEGGRVIQVGTPQELLNNPASPYVEAFFKGVDASRLLTAGDLAENAGDRVVRSDSDAQGKASNHPYRYLVDDRDRLLGVWDASSDTPKRIAREDLCTAGPETSLHEMLGLASSVPYPIPVVANEGTLSGVVSKDALLRSLCRQV
ncbi:quaternary amine ABC transporter ATP-binding protein [Halomonas sp. V046]|uniref:quaternary amine ABC transporter ATP-binding protein n=1 Tax=Halomonas sp. V046 TaxID=3459611 RepID=UPI004043F94E